MKTDKKILIVGNKRDEQLHIKNVEQYFVVGVNRLCNLQCVDYKLDMWYLNINNELFFKLFNWDDENIVNAIKNVNKIAILWRPTFHNDIERFTENLLKIRPDAKHIMSLLYHGGDWPQVDELYHDLTQHMHYYHLTMFTITVLDFINNPLVEKPIYVTSCDLQNRKMCLGKNIEKSFHSCAFEYESQWFTDQQSKNNIIYINE